MEQVREESTLEELTNEEVTETEEPEDETGAEEEETEDAGSSTGEETPQKLFTQEQLDTAVRNRVNSLNKKMEKLKPYQAAVENIGRVTGLSVDQVTQRLGNMSVQEQAKLLNVSPEQIEQRNRLAESQRQITEQALQLQREAEKQKILADPKCKDFAIYEASAMDLLEDNPKLTLKQAYILAKGDQAIEAVTRDAEQRAIAKMTASSNQKTIKPGQSTASTAKKLDSATISAAKSVGMDPAEYAAYANMSSLEDYERYTSKKKG